MTASIPVRRKKKRGRPATGVDPLFNFRMPGELAARLDTWREALDPPLSRSEAIRELLDRGLPAANGVRDK